MFNFLTSVFPSKSKYTFNAVLHIQIFFSGLWKICKLLFPVFLSTEIDEIAQAFEVYPFSSNCMCCFAFLCACICLPRGPVHGICINLVWYDEHFTLGCLLHCYFMPKPGALLALCMVIHLLAQKWKWIVCPITLTPSQVCCAFNQLRRNYMRLHKSGFFLLNSFS